MAKARTIIKRRRAVSNIKKITQTMQLIATARFQKCQQRAVASQPYTRKITEMIQTLGGGQQAANHVLLKPNENDERSIVLVITSNRGLCGAYNASVLRRLMATRESLAEEGLTPGMEVVGKKGINYLRFLGVDIDKTVTDIEDKIEFGRVSEMAERYMDLYERGEIARVDVVYMRFHSVGVQRPTVAQLLPIEPADADASDEGQSETNVQFEFSPEPEELLQRLIPAAVKIRLFQCFNDAIVSEQVSRMVAMKAATDAGNDMIKYLTRQYNRARQSTITTELADIVGGAEAVK